jgi:ssDNA-binding Zn-finger/Zn-ribbon topoisomerase 1
MNVENCSNCGGVIGKLEQAYVFHENVVCQHCYRRLTDTEDKQVQATIERPIEVKAEAVPPQTEARGQKISCPKCGSTQITANKKGFGGGKGLGGALLLGPLGLLYGFRGSNKILATCLNCGHQWECGKN